jgi:micrococcal nuclease
MRSPASAPLFAILLAVASVAPPVAQAQSNDETARVTAIVDGDTIRATIDGRRVTIRYIGIDAPERAARGKAADCFASQATQANRALVLNKTVRLEQDTTDTDSSGRMLRYVFLADGRMVNEEMVQYGFARAVEYPPDIAYQDVLNSAQAEAVAANAGLWAKCGKAPAAPASLIGSPAPTTASPAAAPAPAAPPPAPAQSGNCDPSYPTVCIPPAPPDLDCPEIPFRRFQVLPPDPHRFDRDKDGIGCES